MATLLNVNRDAKKHPDGFKPEDIMPWLREKPARGKKKQQTPEMTRQILEQLTREMGGIVRLDRIPLDAK